MTIPGKPPTLSEFITRQLCTVESDLSLDDAQQRMALNGIRHLAVLDGTTISGVISSRDLGLAAGVPGVDPAKTPVSTAVTGPALHVPLNTPLADVCAIMEGQRAGSVVVTERREAIGIFTTTDALRALRQLLTGQPAARLHPPTHTEHNTAGDPQHAGRATARESLASHRARPSPNDGKFGRGPV